MKKREINKILSLGVSLLALAVVAACDKFPRHGRHAPDATLSVPLGKNYNYEDILCTRVVDGDTLQLESGERVRLIGIDTPEMHESNKLFRDAQRSGQDAATIKQMGRRSYQFTRQLVEGKRLRLEFDVERHDRYNRLLAYAYLPDGTFVNARIVSEGYASLLTIPPDVKYAQVLLPLYRQARQDKKGLWQQ